MIQLTLKCPYCNESLMDEDVRIADHPSIKLIVDHYGKKGSIHLCSIYGDYSKESTINIPDGEVVRVLCPKCEANLGSNTPCAKCGAPMVLLRSSVGGTIQFCSRHGCTKHHVEFENLDSELEAFYQAYHLG